MYLSLCFSRVSPSFNSIVEVISHMGLLKTNITSKYFFKIKKNNYEQKSKNKKKTLCYLHFHFMCRLYKFCGFIYLFIPPPLKYCPKSLVKLIIKKPCGLLGQYSTLKIEPHPTHAIHTLLLYYMYLWS